MENKNKISKQSSQMFTTTTICLKREERQYFCCKLRARTVKHNSILLIDKL